jgi:carbonic anhydrase/acetyltransferase-like protein (isoleucine patch superfamily)
MNPILYESNGNRPQIDSGVSYIASTAIIDGDVEIGRGCVIFDSVVIEGNAAKIRIGEFTNIQSGTIIHASTGLETIIGNYCTIGHQSVLHGCTLEDCVVVGLGSVIMDHSLIRRGGFVAAGSLITEWKDFPENALIVGRPGKFFKDRGKTSCDEAKRLALLYEKLAKEMETKRIQPE